MLLPIFYSLVLGLTHFFNEKIQIKHEYVHVRLVSFVSGITVTYVCLILLPEIYRGFALFNQFIFISILVGFTLAHISEKYVYQHSAPQTLKENLSGLHSLAFFVYHLLLGVIFVSLNQVNTLNSVLFFLPVLFYSSVGLISLEKIHSKVREHKSVKFLLSLSTLFGVLLADLLLSFGNTYNLIFGFIVGLFLYIALIDFVPKESRGRPEFFALGVFVYTLVIASTFT